MGTNQKYLESQFKEIRDSITQGWSECKPSIKIRHLDTATKTISISKETLEKIFDIMIDAAKKEDDNG